MDYLRLLSETFTRLNNPKGVPFWVLAPIRRILRSLANNILPYYLSRGGAYSTDKASGVIVSLTSFPGRIGVVWQVVETLKRQSMRPEKILLWLSRNQFPTVNEVPLKLFSLQDDIFTIRMVDGDIRSHKKYFYVMQEFPNHTIITCDDDIYYHPDTIKHLVETGKYYPNCIIANVTNQLKYSGQELLPYNEWERNFEKFSSHNRVQIGVGGVLYPPGSLDKKVFDQEILVKVAPLADDLWLNCMARLAKTPIVQSDFHYLWMEIHTKAPSLTSVNNGSGNMNDKQLYQIRDYLRKADLTDVYNINYANNEKNNNKC